MHSLTYKQYISLVGLWCLAPLSTISNTLILPYTEITNEVCAYLIYVQFNIQAIYHHHVFLFFVCFFVV